MKDPEISSQLDLKDLIETMIKVYKLDSEYILVVYKNTSLYYIGTRSL